MYRHIVLSVVCVRVCLCVWVWTGGMVLPFPSAAVCLRYRFVVTALDDTTFLLHECEWTRLVQSDHVNPFSIMHPRGLFP